MVVYDGDDDDDDDYDNGDDNDVIIIIIRSYHVIFRCPYHFLKLPLFLELIEPKRLSWPSAVEWRYINT